MSTESQAIEFDDLKGCSFLPTASGTTTCLTHDVPAVFGLHGFSGLSSACEQRKQWLNTPTPSHNAEWTKNDYLIDELLKRQVLPGWLQAKIVDSCDSGSDIYVVSNIVARTDLDPEVEIQLAQSDKKWVRSYIAHRICQDKSSSDSDRWLSAGENGDAEFLVKQVAARQLDQSVVTEVNVGIALTL